MHGGILGCVKDWGICENGKRGSLFETLVGAGSPFYSIAVTRMGAHLQTIMKRGGVEEQCMGSAYRKMTCSCLKEK